MRVSDIVNKLLFPYNYIRVFDTDMQEFVWQGEALCASAWCKNFIVDTIEIDNGVLRLNAHPEKNV